MLRKKLTEFYRELISSIDQAVIRGVPQTTVVPGRPTFVFSSHEDDGLQGQLGAESFSGKSCNATLSCKSFTLFNIVSRPQALQRTISQKRKWACFGKLLAHSTTCNWRRMTSYNIFPTIWTKSTWLNTTQRHCDTG